MSKMEKLHTFLLFKEELEKLEEEVNKKYVGYLIFKEKEGKRAVEEIIEKFQDLIDKYYNKSFLKKRYKVATHLDGCFLGIDVIDPDTGKIVEYLEEIINED